MINLLNGNCYKLIKEIPDKSIDLIYTDVPYLYKKHGDPTKSRVGKNIEEKNKAISKMSDGIDYAILDEFIRVCKFPYIYIYMV